MYTLLANSIYYAVFSPINRLQLRFSVILLVSFVTKLQQPMKLFVVVSLANECMCVLQVGDILTVLNMHLNGQWEGELNGRRGLFPFNYVEFI